MIACVQMKLRAEDYRTEESFAARIMGIMERIRVEAGEGRLLVAFPEHIGTFCILSNAPERVWAKGSFAQPVKHCFCTWGAVAPSDGGEGLAGAGLLWPAPRTGAIYLSPFVCRCRKLRTWMWRLRSLLGAD